MKSLRRLCLSLGLLAFAAIQATAQDDLNKFLKENVGDAEKLVGAYVSPLMKSVSSGLNQGWYNTAKPHKTAGVDLTLSMNLMTIPADQLFYNVPSLGLQHLELHSSSPDYATKQAPTFFGPDRAPIFYDKQNDPGALAKFSGPPGIDLKGKFKSSKMPVPTLNLGFGLPKGFDVKVRFIPQTNIGSNTNINLFGLGIMHDVKQYIPGIKNLPFDLSGFVGYTSMKMESKFDTDHPDKNEHGVFQMNAITIQGIISKKISVLTVYGSAGYNIAKSKMQMLGTYTIDESTNTSVQDPINLKFASSGPRISAGFRLKLAVFTFHTDYTLQKYSCLTAGFGISVR
jgi:hypothetical protein